MLSPRCRLPLALLLLLLSAAVAAQVLGLTNYSHWDKAAEMRACMLRHDDIAGEQTGCHSTAALCRESVRNAPQAVCSAAGTGATVSTLGLLFSCLLRGQVLSGLAWLLAVGVS